MRASASLFVLLFACRGPEQPAWAALHGSLRETDTGVEGHLVWELFDKKWGRRHDAERHVCARVQAIVGEVDDTLGGCDDCSVWALRSTELDTDCVAPWDASSAFAGPTHLGLGARPASLAGVGPHGDVADGWYLSWDARTLEAHGVAHDESLDLSAAAAATRTDAALVLTPSRAWRVDP